MIMLMFSSLTSGTQQITNNISPKQEQEKELKPKVKQIKQIKHIKQKKANNDVFNYIKTLETFVDTPTDGYIGWGHKIKKRESFTKIDSIKGDSLLLKDFNYAIEIISKDLRKLKKQLNPNQLNAISLFIFNLGQGNYYESTLRKYVLNNHSYHSDSINKYFTLYSNLNGEFNSVIFNRRTYEASLFTQSK